MTIQTRRLHGVFFLAALVTCAAVMPEVILAQDVSADRTGLAVDEVVAVDYFGAVEALRFVGSRFDSGNRVEVTLDGTALVIERASATDIVAKLPEGFVPRTYEMAVSVVDEQRRLAQAVAFDVFLPAELSGPPEKSIRVLWTETGDGAGAAVEAKAISAYVRRTFSFTCRNNFHCTVRRTCPNRYFASGGGMTVSGSSTTRSYIMESYPSSNSSWTARSYNISGRNPDRYDVGRLYPVGDSSESIGIKVMSTPEATGMSLPITMRGCDVATSPNRALCSESRRTT